MRLTWVQNRLVDRLRFWLWSGLRDQLSYQLRGPIRDRLDDQVWSQMEDQLYTELLERLRDHLDNKENTPIKGDKRLP